MKSCCGSTDSDSNCKRKDGKSFSLPRKFSKSKCKNSKGFTMKSSCAPYKYCSNRSKKGGNRSKKGDNRKKRSSKRTKKNVLPKLKPINDKNVKHKYKLSDPQNKRILAIDEGINMEAKKIGKTIRKAAISKKGRFNILRIYRKNKRPEECKRITSDMKYIDKKYKLGDTKNICKRSLTGGVAMSGLHSKRLQQQKPYIRKRRNAVPNMEEGSRHDSDDDFEDAEEYDYDDFYDALENLSDRFYDASENLDIPNIRTVASENPILVYLKMDKHLCENLPFECSFMYMTFYDLTLVLEFNGAGFKIVDLLDESGKNIYDNSSWAIKRTFNSQNINSKKDVNNILNLFFFKSDRGNIINNIYENHPVQIIENVYMFKIGNDNKVIILDFNDIMKKYMTTNILPDILYPIITITKCSLEDSKLSNKCIDKSKCKECVTNNNITGGKKKI